MMKVRSKQMQALETSFRAQRRREIWRTLKDRYPSLCESIKDNDALKRIDEAIQDGKSIDIVEDEDVIRFAALSFLPQSVTHDPQISSIFIRTLNRIEWEASKRLDFLYENIITKLNIE